MILGRVGVTPNYPATIPGVVLQLDAATLSASPVSSWSYGAGNFTQATGASQPLWTASSANVNNLPSVVYDSTKVMSAPSTTALQLVGDMTIATVMYFAATPSLFTVVSKGVTGGIEFDVYLQNSSVAFGRGLTGVISPVLVTGQLCSLILTIMGKTATFYVNGRQMCTGPTTGLGPGATSNAIFIGQRTDAGTKLNGEQPELLLVNRALTPIEIATLALFWNIKYNILPGTF
jgi:hypothetical protein